jgi:hypothetical protein
VLQWIAAEPKFPLAIVPCDTYFISLTEVQKLTRLYLPRSYQALNASYDVIVFHDISPTVIPTRVLNFIHDAFAGEGLGLGWIAYYYWGGTNDVGLWMNLVLYHTFPAEIDVTKYYPSQLGRTYWSVVRRQPIFDLPGIEEQPMQVIGNRGGDIHPRPGSVVHAVWRGRKTPVLATGAYESGISLQLAQGWHNPAAKVFNSYRYLPDLIYNQLYFLADVPPPDELEVAHRARELFIDARVRKSVTLSMMEFVEKFGARLDEIEKEIAGLEPVVLAAEGMYMAGDHAAAAEMLRNLMDRYPAIEEDLARLMRRTMLWIYMSEWITVASAGLVCGVIVWNIMVRRRFYRDVAATRLGSLARDT